VSLYRWMQGCWQERQRKIDIEVLWPSLCQNAPTIDAARRAFGYHATRDSAWTVLPDDERRRRIENLKPPGGDG
jgi:hypothetical protein